MAQRTLCLIVGWLVAAAAAISCAGATEDDRMPPFVSLDEPSSPADAGYVFIDGVETLRATASDNVGVVGVHFFAGSIDLGEDTSAPYQALFDTSVWDDGQGSYFKAVARDAAANTSEDQIYVRKVTLPPDEEPTDGGLLRDRPLQGWSCAASPRGERGLWLLALIAVALRNFPTRRHVIELRR